MILQHYHPQSHNFKKAWRAYISEQACENDNDTPPSISRGVSTNDGEPLSRNSRNTKKIGFCEAKFFA